MGSSTAITLFAPAATHSCASRSMPAPSSAHVTGPPSLLPTPISSGTTGLSFPSSVASAITSTPFGIRCLLNQLHFAKAQRQLLALLCAGVAFDPLRRDRRIRHKECFQIHAVCRRANAKVRQRPRLYFLLGREHDLAELRVAGLAELVADRHHARRRCF